tara:strand:+ start:61 stop:687 length:627 start_codon:yes stop_codon:yes gene_type:complete
MGYFMNWFDIIKIRDTAGNYLIVKDVELFKRNLKNRLNEVSLPFWGKVGQMGGENPEKQRKSNVVIKEKYQGDEKLILNVSIRSPHTTKRMYYPITLLENDEGDFIYLTALGPNLSLGGDDVLSGEEDLVEKIASAVQTTITQHSPTGKKTAWLTDRTEQDIKESVEAANPGSRYIRGKLYTRKELLEMAEKKGITVSALMYELEGNR